MRCTKALLSGVVAFLSACTEEPVSDLPQIYTGFQRGSTRSVVTGQRDDSTSVLIKSSFLAPLSHEPTPKARRCW